MALLSLDDGTVSAGLGLGLASCVRAFPVFCASTASSKGSVVTLTKSLLAFTALGCLGLVGTAHGEAQSTCTTDADCARGTTCQVWAIVATTTPACPPNEICASAGTGGTTATGAIPADGGTATPNGGTRASPGGTSGAGNATGAGGSPDSGGTTVVTTTIWTCQPGPCTTDSDCGTDMVCHAQTSTECSGGGATPPCEPGTKCGIAAIVTEPTCTTITTSTCAYLWQLPCNADADCGAGFVCQPSVSGECSGGSAGGSAVGSGGSSGQSSSGPPENTSPPAQTGDTCTTTKSFPGSCQTATTVCTSDADCPANWLCQAPLTRGSIGAGGAGVGGGAGTDSHGVSSGSGVDPTVDPTAAIPKLCAAPNLSPLPAKDRAGGTGASGPGVTGTGGTTAGGATPPEGATVSGGAGGAGGTNGVNGVNGMNGAHDPGAASAGDAAGCAVIPHGAPSPSGAALPALLVGLTLVLRRSRPRSRGRGESQPRLPRP